MTFGSKKKMKWECEYIWLACVIDTTHLAHDVYLLAAAPSVNEGGTDKSSARAENL